MRHAAAPKSRCGYFNPATPLNVRYTVQIAPHASARKHASSKTQAAPETVALFLVALRQREVCHAVAMLLAPLTLSTFIRIRSLFSILLSVLVKIPCQIPVVPGNLDLEPGISGAIV